MTNRFTLFSMTAIGLSLAVHAASPAYAAGNKRVDPLIQHAIEQTAQPDPVVVEEAQMEPMTLITAEEEVMTAVEEPAPVVEAPPPMAITEAEPKDVHTGPGYRVGNMLFLPALEIREEYDDNILTTQTNQIDDFITAVMPSLTIKALDTRHDITLETAYEYRHFQDEGDQSEQNFKTRLHGFIEAVEGITFPFNIGWKRDHEKREDDLTVQLSDTPHEQQKFDGSLGVRYKPGRFGIGLSGHYENLRYDNSVSTAGALIMRSDADHEVTGARLMTDFDLNPENTLMLSGWWADRNYQNNNFQGGGFNGPPRDSEVIQIMAGWNFKRKGLNAEFKLGYADWEYDSSAIEDVHDIIARAGVNWTIDNTTLMVAYDRSVFEDDQVIQPIISDKGELWIKHTVASNIHLGLGGIYEYRDFTGLARADDLYTLALSADYDINDNISVGAEYDYTTRDSDANGIDYDRNVVMVRLNGKI